jgi:hypothetical protein
MSMIHTGSNNTNTNTGARMTANQPTTTSTATSTDLPVIPGRLVRDRLLAQKGVSRGMERVPGMHLEEVRDHLRLLASRQEPTNHERQLAHLNLDFTGGRLVGRFLNANGLSEPHFISKTAWQQIAPEVLPARGGGFLLDQANLGEHGEKLSNMSWALFAREADTPRLLRTVKQKHGDKVVPVIRSCHSQGYATYDNLTFIEDILANVNVTDLPVLQYHLSDSGMRVRFALEPVDRIELRKPVPMMEAWNSEVGLRKTVFKGGTFRLVCTNGMTTTETSAEWGWRHYGSSDRIRRGVESAIADLRTTASGVVDLYNKSLETSIDDAFAWMMQELELAGVSAETRTKAVNALDHETTTPGRLLASTIDAVTLIAQDFDLFEQAELEAVGARLLTRGLNQARNGRIPAFA